MTTEPFKEPCLTDAGVVFTVEVDSVPRECVISRSALLYLCRLQGFTMDLMNTYRACEARIHKAARQLLRSGTAGSPLVLGTAAFT
jgi:hypothetical protein